MTQPLLGRLARTLSRQPVVSVVVPVHNTAAYVLDCLRSLESQTTAMEVVIVDDGSTDDSLAIAREWARGRRGAVVVSQPNRGPGGGAARNTGLRRARAPWVMFLDSDDLLAPGGLDALVRAASESPADLVIGRVETFPEPRRWVWDSVFAGLGEPVTVPITEVSALVHNPAPGNKLFRRSALRRRGLSFAERVHHQDTVVSVPTMLLSDVITVVPDLVLRYRRHDASVMSRHFDRALNFMDHVTVAETLVEMSPDLTPERRALLDAFLARSMQGFVLRVDSLDDDLRAEFTARAKAVFASVDLGVVASSTASYAHRQAYARILGCPTPERDAPVSAIDGVLYRGVSPDPLTRLGPVVARLTTGHESTSSGHLDLTGTLKIDGLSGEDIGALDLSLRLRGTGLAVPVSVAEPAVDPTLWMAAVDAEQVKPGRHAARLVVGTALGQASAAVRVHPQAPPGGTASWEFVWKRDRLLVGRRAEPDAAPRD